MDDPTIRPSLVPPLANYFDYFTRAKANNLHGYYAAALCSYKINTKNAATSAAPTEVARYIYTVA